MTMMICIFLGGGVNVRYFSDLIKFERKIIFGINLMGGDLLLFLFCLGGGSLTQLFANIFSLDQIRLQPTI